MWKHRSRRSKLLPKLRRLTFSHRPTIPARNYANHSGLQNTKSAGVGYRTTSRTRGVFGKFIAGFESMIGGEVTAFTSEMEKARWEAIERAKNKAVALGANAIIGLDVETSDLGLQAGIVLFSATGTAVIIEAE